MSARTDKKRLQKAILAEALRVYREDRPGFPVKRFTLSESGECSNSRFEGWLDHFSNLMEVCRQFDERSTP